MLASLRHFRLLRRHGGRWHCADNSGGVGTTRGASLGEAAHCAATLESCAVCRCQGSWRGWNRWQVLETSPNFTIS